MNVPTESSRGNLLLEIARAAIASRFGLWFETSEDDVFLLDHAACFVTLTQSGRLRGCIGSLQPHRPLLNDVKANALAAAFQDPRFPPLASSELYLTSIEVSLLSALTPIEIRDEEDALAQLRPGTDGVVLQCGPRRGTFLPQVWDSLPEPRRFLGQLKRKAGLPTDFWSNDIRLYRYHVEKWSEGQ